MRRMAGIANLDIRTTLDLDNNATNTPLVRLKKRTLSQPLVVFLPLPSLHLSLNNLLLKIMLPLISLSLRLRNGKTLTSDKNRKAEKNQAGKNQQRAQNAPENTPIHSRP